MKIGYRPDCSGKRRSKGGRQIMGSEKKYCSICAWRANCQKRFSVVTDASGCVRCPDYSRDLSIKDKDIDAAEAACRDK